jgi:MOSC domain-containing protein YiiM
MPTLHSLNVAIPQTIPAGDPPFDREWSSGIFKKPVTGKLWLRAPPTSATAALTSDLQEDPEFHGGPDKAINCYSFDYYPFWKAELELEDFPVGAFGENFTTAELADEDVCVGDRYEIGEALVEVSQPRSPCWKLSWRWRIAELERLLLIANKTGWYFRVIREGFIEQGQELKLVERKYPNFSITQVNTIRYRELRNLKAAKELADCEELSETWRRTFHHRLASSDFRTSY